MIAGGLLVVTYVLLAREDVLDESGVHVSYAIAFTLIGLLYTAVLPATGITTEKESRAWPVLLTTTVGDWAIVASKFGGVIRRCLPAWGLLFAHVTLFVLVGIIHPIALVQLVILMLWALVFLSATGLYFSSRFRHTTAAVIANAALAGVLWAVLLFLLVLVADLLDWNGEAFLTFYIDMNPIMHTGAILDATVTVGQIEVYHWTQDGISSLGETMRWLLFCCALYSGVGVLFLWRAKARLRRNPF
jgi:ABC-type transport system involved in multi-copper enzyme maturation permease subunit